MLSLCGRSARALSANRASRLLCTSASPPCPYSILGVPRGASTADIKSAYRREAMKHHPDRSEAADGQRFVELAVAYSTLTGAGNGGAGAGGMTHADAERILDSISDCRKVVEMLILDLLENARTQRKEERARSKTPPRPGNIQPVYAENAKHDAESRAHSRLIARYPSVLPVMPLPPSRHGPLARAPGARREDLVHASSWNHLVQDAASLSNDPMPHAMP
jgi:hypothetical protein